MAPNAVPHGPSDPDWTEAEKEELLDYYKFCIEQRDKCIENLEAIYQEQKDLEALNQEEKNSEQRNDDSDGDHDKKVQIQSDDLVRKAADEVTLMEGYLDILIFIEAEMDANDLSNP
ncbi:hypothetical protein FPOAC2_11899 [Fusarium poae]|jgi:hypothetical protein|uniref:Uncharacterized protein n=1 Tax=Fusarium poae TaxID=36050 RepID=A0A1B8AEX5_FUSPO|nr:hypothetical protein FPOAC1_011591 [Fusarium poae]KAG8666774.1 hypothetical protein FPOAC1_011591 [Fusarium poae]OBS19022.1 hypothetical protein FPOA_10747 [Fusarium poae]